MKNKIKIIIYFCLAIISFTAIMIYIRMDNDKNLRQNLVKEWTRNYIVKEQKLAYVNVTPQTKKTTVSSEAQGYGMVIAAFNDYANPQKFEQLYHYYMLHREKNSQLMSWKQIKYKQKWHVEHNSETNGDILIAHALLLTNNNWPQHPEYKKQALKILHDVLRDEYNPKTVCLTVGNWVDKKTRLNNLLKTSVVCPSLFDEFYQATGDSKWLQIKHSMLQKLLYLSKQHESGLIPDFAWINKGKAYPIKNKVTINAYDSYYSSNACRIPMLLAKHNDPLAKKVLNKMLKFFSKQHTVYAGYTLNGEPLNKYQSACFSAPIFVAVNYTRAKGYDNLYLSQQYVLTRPLPKDNYNDAVITTLAAIATKP